MLLGVTLLVSNDYDKLIPLTVAVVTRTQASQNECADVHDDNVDESARMHLSVATTHTDTQNSVVNDLVVCSDARQAEGK